jgi:predicted enzyme related to lactoylglutathione lyase
MKILEFAFIAYPATEESRARAFYEGILGLAPAMEMREGDQFWIEYEIGPHTLGIGNEPFMKPSADGAQLVLEVDDFDTAVTHLRARGVPFAVDPFDLPACRAAVIVDPDGNRLGIHRRNPT